MKQLGSVIMHAGATIPQTLNYIELCVKELESLTDSERR